LYSKSIVFSSGFAKKKCDGLTMLHKMSLPVEPVNPSPSQFKSGTHEHLREVCLAHLNLIHKMSETIIAKDRQIKILKENNQQVSQES
jgi:hypothetical protein